MDKESEFLIYNTPEEDIAIISSLETTTEHGAIEEKHRQNQFVQMSEEYGSRLLIT